MRKIIRKRYYGIHACPGTQGMRRISAAEGTEGIQEIQE